MRLIALRAKEEEQHAKEEEQHAKQEEQLMNVWAALAVVGMRHRVDYPGERRHRWTPECDQSLGRVVGDLLWLRCVVVALEGSQQEPLRDRKATGTDIRLFQQVLGAGAFGIEHVRPEANPADIITKALPRVKHTRSARLCSVVIGDMPAEEE